MQARFKRFTALILSLLMALTCMPMGALAEETVIPGESIRVEVIPEDAEEPLAQEPAPVTGAEIPSDEETLISEAVPEAEAPASQDAPDETPSVSDSLPEETKFQAESAQEEPVQEEKTPSGELPAEEPVAEPTTEPTTEPATKPTAESPAEPAEDAKEPEAPPPSVEEQESAETVKDNRHPLQAAIATYGHIYVATAKQTDVFSKASLDADTLVFSTTRDVFLLMATKFTDQESVKVWFLDADGNVVNGYVSAKDLDEKYLLDEDIGEIHFLPVGQGMTDIGEMPLFHVNGAYPTEEAESLPVEGTTDEPFEEQPVDASAEDSQEPAEDEPASDPELIADPVDIPEAPEALPEGTEDEEPQEDDGKMPEEATYAAAGSYVRVTTNTRVFATMDAQAQENYYSGEYLGNFVKDATVQILSVDFDEAGDIWYEVRFLYGDDFKDGTMKWTDYATCWILAAETGEATDASCTVTDFAYTMEFLTMSRSSGRRKLQASPMNGFTLKNINGPVGGFYAWSANLYGSSGRDREYPQIAKSASHGTVYATPHYLEGFTVFCLEHNLSGPGEGSGSSMTAKGPYVLVDMDSFVNNASYGGTSGVRYKASTMHALGWVLRHTYPFMALNRSDSNNEVWSRVAGQFAMREVIKQLEGAQYVRSYWDLDSFYSFSGGAPAVYLEYARWLASNGIARAKITGKITASNQSLSVSGSSYIGTVTLTTDADLIRIPKSAGTITGNSGGSDSSYYYVKSGDTIRITSTQSKFSVSMQSISSSDEEANFLVGVPSVSIQKVLVPLYGAPYPLQSASITFELSLGEIAVTKKSDDGILLKGTVFELLNGSGTVLATATTNDKGVATFASLQPGTYTVREKTASQGYKLSSASQSISVVAGVTSKAEFTNARISGRIRIVKTDAVTEKPLPGAVFTVTRLSGPESDNAPDVGKVVATITTNAEGIAETGLLPWGEYRIDETGVPEDYLDAGYTTTVWIK